MGISRGYLRRMKRNLTLDTPPRMEVHNPVLATMLRSGVSDLCNRPSIPRRHPKTLLVRYFDLKPCYRYNIEV